METFDVLIVGAGVVGLAVARELSATSLSILVVERHAAIGQETSSRNSEVIHGGMYYPPGTLKARLCVDGRGLLYQYLEESGIGYRKCGKLIVAQDDDEVRDIEKLYRQGIENRVEGLRLEGPDGLRRLEPDVRGVGCLVSEATGIFDTHRYMDSLRREASENGVLFLMGCAVVSVEIAKDVYQAGLASASGTETVRARHVINCAGLDADQFAENSGFPIEGLGYRLHYCKGRYARVSDRWRWALKHLVYPVPKPRSGGLGVHATLDLAGGLRLGPDDVYLKDRRQDYSIDAGMITGFYASIRSLLPFINEADLSPDTAGIRPKLAQEGEGFRDFIIREESDRGKPGFINCIGIESPGLTASLAIGRYVRNIISGGR